MRVLVVAVVIVASAIATCGSACAVEVSTLLPAGADAFKFNVTWAAASPEPLEPATFCCAGNHTNAVGHPAHPQNSVVHWYWTEWHFVGSWQRQAWDEHAQAEPASGFVTFTYTKVGAAYYPGVAGTKPTTPPAPGHSRVHSEYWGRKGSKTCKHGNDVIHAEAWLGAATDPPPVCTSGDYCITKWPKLWTQSASGKVTATETVIENCAHATAAFTVGEEWPKGRFDEGTQADIELKTYIKVEEDHSQVVDCGGKGYTTPLRTDWRYYHDEADCSAPASVSFGIQAGPAGVFVSVQQNATVDVDVFPPPETLTPVTCVRPEAPVCGTLCAN